MIAQKILVEFFHEYKLSFVGLQLYSEVINKSLPHTENMVINKFKYLIGPGRRTYSPPS